MLFMKVEMLGIQKSAMPHSFSNFDLKPIYRAGSAGSRTYPFGFVFFSCPSYGPFNNEMEIFLARNYLS